MKRKAFSLIKYMNSFLRETLHLTFGCSSEQCSSKETINSYILQCKLLILNAQDFSDL